MNTYPLFGTGSQNYHRAPRKDFPPFQREDQGGDGSSAITCLQACTTQILTHPRPLLPLEGEGENQ